MTDLYAAAILHGLKHAALTLEATALLLEHVHPHTSAQHALECAQICIREARSALHEKTPTAATDLTIVIHPRC